MQDPPNRELHVATINNVLDLELGELGVGAKLLDDTRVFAQRQMHIVFRPCTSDDPLARYKKEARG